MNSVREASLSLSLSDRVLSVAARRLRETAQLERERERERERGREGGRGRERESLRRLIMGRVHSARQGQRHGKNRGVSKAHEKREVAERRLAAVAAVVSEGLGDWRQAVVEQEAKLESELIEHVRAILSDAEDHAMPLAAAGAALQERVRRSALRGDDGMILNTSRHIKARYGGWDGFARSAPQVLRVEGERLRLVPEPCVVDVSVGEKLEGTRVARPDLKLSEVREVIPSVLSSLALGGDQHGDFGHASSSCGATKSK